jgi:transposase
MQRRTFGREFKTEAAKLVRERGVSFTHASRDLDIAESALRRLPREASTDPGHAFPGQVQPRLT